MSAPMLVAAALALATLMGIWRSLRRETGVKARLLWSAMSLLAAAAFWLLLYPPQRAWREDALNVIVPGGDAAVSSLPSGQSIVALPGADAPARVERVPDLATALRRHPQVRELDIAGDHLPLRDRSVAAALRLRLHSAAEAPGFRDLHWTQRSAAGQQWFVGGGVSAEDATVELRDPAGALVDAVAVESGGRFSLSAPARIAGLARFELNLLDARKQRIDSASLPLEVESGIALSAIVQAGAPSPELKYWRRWASDAGVRIDSHIALSDGLGVGDASAMFDPAALAAADFAVFDERSWLALAPAQKATLLAAVDQGLGLLLRASGPPDAGVLAEWSALGFALASEGSAVSASIDGALSLREHLDFRAAPLSITGGSAAPLLSDDHGRVLIAAVSRGQGRIALSTLLDSFQLVLRGDAGRYGGLWGRLIAEVARARQPATRRPPIPVGWVGERQVLCDLGDQARVISASGAETRLIVSERCAAYWPEEAGWHRLADGDAREPFYVRASGDAESLRNHRDRVATQALASAGESTVAASPVAGRRPMDRWPLLLLWLLPTALLWWRERRPLSPR